MNTAGRDAAVSPGNSDSLAAFAGTYATHLLPADECAQVTTGAEIAINVNSQGELTYKGMALERSWRVSREYDQL